MSQRFYESMTRGIYRSSPVLNAAARGGRAPAAGGNIQPLLLPEPHKSLFTSNSPALPPRGRCFPGTARPGETSAPWFSGRLLRTPKAGRGRLRAGRPLPGLPLTSSGSAGEPGPGGAQIPAGSPDPGRSTDPGGASASRGAPDTAGSTDPGAAPAPRGAGPKGEPRTRGKPRPEGSKAPRTAPAPRGRPGPKGSPGPGGSPDLHWVCTALSTAGLCPACLMGMLCFGAAPALSPQIHQSPCPSHPPSRCTGGKTHL